MTSNLAEKIREISSAYSNDIIFIIGKGPSVDNIPPEVYKGSLTIGINDAERIFPTDITIFHADWVKHSLDDTGPRARLYLTSTDFIAPDSDVVLLPHVPLQQDNADLMMQRLLSSEFVIEDVLFITALRVAREVARQLARPQRVLMVGFDFQPELGYAHFEGKHYEIADAQERRLIIGMQENFLLNALYALRNSDVELIHVGARSYSHMNIDGLITEFMPAANSADMKTKWDTAVIAEITTNHFGDRRRLENIVIAAKAAGADYIKVQKRDVATFYSQEQLASQYRSPFGSTFADYRYQLELSGDDFTFLDRLCQRLDIQWFASALDEKSYAFLMDFKPPIIKIPSTISDHVDYIAKVADHCNVPVVLSTGMTDRNYEEWILEKFKRVPQLYMMQANSAYPTSAVDCNVAVVRHYNFLSKSDPRIVPAYSSHDEGWFGSALAVAAGARMVEKHVKLGDTEWAHFDAVALDLTKGDFREYVAKIREAEIILGSETKKVNTSEHHKYRR